MFTDFRHAARKLVRAPRFALISVFTIALALACVATLFNLIEGFVLRPVGVEGADRLVRLRAMLDGTSRGFSLDQLLALAERQTALEGLCAVTAGYGAMTVQLPSGRAAQRPVEAVSGECYEVLGVRPLLGRGLTAEDAAPIAPADVALVTHRVWREELGSRSDVIGQVVHVEGRPLTIAGVLPRGYRGVNADEAPTLALPLPLAWKLLPQPPTAMDLVGRLRPGVALDEAAAHLQALWPELRRPGTPRGTTGEMAPALDVSRFGSGFSVLRDRYRQPLVALIALGMSLLLLAAVNVGGLTVGRLLDRRQASAVEVSLGSTQMRLCRQLFFESALITAAATLVAVPAAAWCSRIAAASLWTGYRPFTIEPTAMASTAAFSAAVALLATILISLPGMLMIVFQNWELAPRARSTDGRTRGRNFLVAVQVAACFALAVAATTFTTGLYALLQLPPGYDAANLQWVSLDRSGQRAPAADQYSSALLSKISTLGNVRSAAMASGFGRRSRSAREDVTVRGDGAGSAVTGAMFERVSPGFFETLGIGLEQGREFTWNEVERGAGVAILSRTLAGRLFETHDIVGRTLRVGSKEQPMTIVGVVADATAGDPRIDSRAVLYAPLTPQPALAPVIFVRTSAGELPIATLREAIEPMGRHVVARAGRAEDELGRFLAHERLVTLASVWFAAIAVIVTIAGLYASLAQSVARRTREIGIRIAVGATPSGIRALIFGNAFTVVILGLLLGVPAAIAAQHAARGLMPEVSSGGGAALAIVASALAALAALITTVPARRAARVDLAAALRAE